MKFRGVIMFATVASLAIFLAACTTVNDEFEYRYTSHFIRYSTTACYGECPIVDIFAFPDGGVFFRGFRPTFSANPKHPDIAYEKTTITISAYKRLVDFLIDNDFTTLANDYNTPSQCGETWSDNPSLILEVQGRALSKKINYYLGCRKFPDEDRLHRMIKEFETVLRVNSLINEYIPVQK